MSSPMQTLTEMEHASFTKEQGNNKATNIFYVNHFIVLASLEPICSCKFQGLTGLVFLKVIKIEETR